MYNKSHFNHVNRWKHIYWKLHKLNVTIDNKFKYIAFKYLAYKYIFNLNYWIYI